MAAPDDGGGKRRREKPLDKSSDENNLSKVIDYYREKPRKNSSSSPEGTPSPTGEANGGSSQNYKIINDPIHGHIQLESILIKIIDTPQFQRLRDIKQLGCTYRVFPGASHNRFEHAIGVCHLAGELVQVIVNLQRDVVTGSMPCVTPVDALCIKIAALCYNLGCGPFSHVFNEMCAEKKVPGWSVEKASVVMFRHLIDENSLKQELRKDPWRIKEKEIIFIEALIDHSVTLPEKMGNKAFLRKVVRDPETSIDAVTMDSIARDSYLLNIPSSFDHKRLVKFVRLNKKTDSEEYVLCYREIEAHDLYSMFLSRLSLQTKAYKHKTVQLLEWMLKQALEGADRALQLTETARDLLSGDQKVRTAAAEKYTQFTDYVMDRITESSDEALRKSKQLWANVQGRELSKFIGTVQTVSGPDSETVAGGVHNAQILELEQLRSDAREKEELKTCVMLMVRYDFGTEQCANPVEHVFFYHKSNPTVPITLKREKVSKILPAVFVEVAVRVYHERSRDPSTYTRVAREFQELIAEKHPDSLKWTGVLPQSSPSTPESTTVSHAES